MTAFRRNDPVVIREVDDIRDHIYVGKTGRFIGTAPGSSARRSYLVEVAAYGGARTVHATRIDRAPLTADRFEVAHPPLTQTGRTNAEETRPETAEVLIDPKRLQAAHAAHMLVGRDAPLDTLIGVAEFVLGEHAKVKRVDLGALAAGSTGPAQAPASSEMSLEEARAITANRVTFDNLEINVDTNPDDDVVQLEGSGEAVYLRVHEVDRLITFLRAAKVVHAAR